MGIGSVLRGSGVAALTAPADNPFLFLAPLNGSLAFADKASGGALNNALTGSGAVRWQAAQGARINYFKDPRARGSGFGNQGGSATATQIPGDAVLGDYAIEASSAALDQGMSSVANYYCEVLNPGTYTFSFDAYSISGGTDWRCYVREKDANNTTVFTSATIPFTLSGGKQRFSFVYTTSGVGVQRFQVLFVRASGTAGVARFTHFVCEPGNNANPLWFDPTAGTWLNLLTGQLGTANNSPSVSQAALWVEEATTNMVLNPRFETGITGWSNYGNNDVGNGRDVTQAYLGVASYKMITTSNASATGITTPAPVTTYSVSPSVPYTLQARVKNNNGGNRTFSARLEWYDASSVFISALTANVVVASFDSFQLVSGTLTSPANAAYVVMRPNFTAGGNSTNGDVFWITNIQLEQKAYATSYADGAMGTGYAWTGTAHASSSTRTAAKVSLPAVTGRIIDQQGAMIARANRLIDPGTYQSIISFHDGVNDRLEILIDQGDQFELWGGHGNGNTLVLRPPTIPIGSWFAGYGEWNGVNTAASYNWETPVSGSARAAPTGIATAAAIGSIATSAGQNFDGLIGTVAIFARQLTASERAKLNVTPLWNWHTLDAA